MTTQTVPAANRGRLAAATPSRLIGIGHYFPGEPVTNAYFEGLEHLGIDDAWIREHTGIRSRHWPERDDERAVEMGARAVEAALADAGLTAPDIDLVIGTTSTTRPRVNPSSATNRYMDISLPLQKQLGLHNAVCFDVGAVACAGFLYSSVVACSLMAALGARNALVVCAENPKPILNFDYRYSVLFGAGGAAAVWQRGEEGTGSGLLDAVFNSDGRYFDAFDIDDDDKMIMKGKQVGDVGPKMLADAARAVLARNGLTKDDIDWFIPHQGNLNMIRQVCADLELPEKQVLVNIEHRGNTSSVSIPSCLSEQIAAGTVKPGDLVLSIGIGRGFNSGAMLFRYR
ncbi:3-oxoacyl-ACP synthase III family protein [Catenulispora rubra]|uniref:3-oxoacyl-ACP synthase III family protein n=1 Tax=Catenulispora rubra TaxID=280293 RepID=UPI0018923ED5|nr:ketoacyl-ACP synthase III [Catenulispora rubra]